MTNIVNLDYEKDIDSWLANKDNIYVGRSNRFAQSTKWGNPFKISQFNSRKQVIEYYREYVLSNNQLVESTSELKGKILGCHCAPEQCHAETLHNLAGNSPVYKKYDESINMAHDHNTRRSNLSDSKPPLSPKPPVKHIKLNTAQLQEKVEYLEQQVLHLLEDSKTKDERLKKMEDRIRQLEHDELKNASYLSVQRNVSSLLSNRVSQLEQYTRRYSVIVSGIDRKTGETKDSLRAEVDSLLEESGSTTKINDVDKLHRNGPRQGAQQDIIVRFKTRTSPKTSLYKRDIFFR